MLKVKKCKSENVTHPFYIGFFQNMQDDSYQSAEFYLKKTLQSPRPVLNKDVDSAIGRLRELNAIRQFFLHGNVCIDIFHMIMGWQD